MDSKNKDQYHQERVIEEAETITGIKNKNVIEAADELAEFSLNARSKDKQEVEGVESFDYRSFADGEKIFVLRQKKEVDTENIPKTEEETLARSENYASRVEEDKQKLKYYESFIDVFAKKHGVITDDLVLFLEDSLKEA